MPRIGVLAAAIVLLVVPAGTGLGGPPRLVDAGHCLAVSKQTLSQKALAVEGKVIPPKKIRDVRPSYPTRQASSGGKGPWLGEALIDANGKVREVWALHELEFDPPWPEFNDAIPAAIRQWEYEPALVKGKAVPVCMTIRMDFHWQ